MNAQWGFRSSARRGIAVAQTAIITTMLGVGVAAIAVDSGLMFSARAELQTVADAAALAAAADLGADSNATENARLSASQYAELNAVNYEGLTIDPVNDVVFGHAQYNPSTGKYEFVSGGSPTDAVRVTARRDATAADGPLQLLFASVFGANTANLSATATAMLVPRDISVVIDLSASMNDDSELRHYTDYDSEVGGQTNPGVQINLEDVWLALPIEKGNNGVGNGVDPAPPGNPSNHNDQPGTGPGSPNSAGGNPSPGANPQGGVSGGPRWGWMTGFGDTITVGAYNPTTDIGLYYIPRYSTTTSSEVIANLTEAGYSSSEISALKSSSYDGTWKYYRNRVLVMTGLAGWKSKKSGGKYNGGPGNGDNRVDDNELTQQAAWPFAQGSWDSYISYVSSSGTQMYNTDSAFRYRYGLKTVVNHLLESNPQFAKTPELADTPELPLQAVKDALQSMTDQIEAQQSLDQMSLEIFAQTGRHEVDLTANLQDVPDRLFAMQAGHYDTTTNIGGGLHKAITELQSVRARPAAAKVIVLMTDGKPNVDQYNNYVGNGAAAAVDWALDRAQYAADNNMRIYTIAVGQDADRTITQEIAEIGHGTEFYASGTPEEYAAELTAIFQTLGGKRPVQLIE